MKPNEFELNVIKALKAIRKLKGAKQYNVGSALGMTTSNYCKLECGQKAISIDQLRRAAEYLQTSYLQILVMAEGELNSKFKANPLSIILVEYVLRLAERDENTGFTKEELESLISKIREHYNKD
jgi:transcriptional regulator with XRE-family HTH domain